MNATRRRLESARVAAVLVAAGSAAPEERALERLAEAIDAFARTGSFPPHPRRARLTWGPERPRTTGQEPSMTDTATPVPGEVHRGAELPYDIDLEDVTSGSHDDWTGVTAAIEVQPPDAGELTAPDAEGKGVWRPNAASPAGIAAVSITLSFADGAPALVRLGALTMDPDVRSAALAFGAERPRTA